MFKRSIKFILAGALLLGALTVTGCSKAEEPTNSTGVGTQQPAPPTSGNTATNELGIEDLVVGSGEEAKAGDVVGVHYTGWLMDGTKFDSSVDRGHPYQFVLGQGMVIEGWDLGVVGMKVGGKRKLTIPPELGYGDQATGPIPAGSTLVFEVELISVGQ